MCSLFCERMSVVFLSSKPTGNVLFQDRRQSMEPTLFFGIYSVKGNTVLHVGGTA